MTQRVVLFFSDGAQALDVTGPASVFGGANTAVQGGPPYEIVVASPSGGMISTISGVPLGSQAISAIPPESVDTLLVAGHDRDATIQLLKNRKARDWVRAVSRHAGRWGSVCSGAFLLAAWGLLSGKSAATHWSVTDELAERFPDVQVDADALFVVDGKIWTSAGVTAGIDMSLALVEADLGKEIALTIGRHLVVYLRRPGSQSQFSSSLKKQCDVSPKYNELITWASTHLKETLTIDALASRMGQSPRTFQRHFTNDVGRPPAIVIEDLRLEQAKALIAHGVSLKVVADEVGYSSSSQLTAVFRRRFGVAPSVWKTMHCN